MTLSSLVRGVILVTLPWLAVEIFAQRWWRSTQRWLVRQGIWNRRKRSVVAMHTLNDKSPNLSRGLLWLKAETTLFNRLPVTLIGRFSMRTGSRKNATLRFYDLGALIGAVSLIASIAIIVFAAYELIDQIVDLADTEIEDHRPGLHKRAEYGSRDSSHEQNRNSLFAVHLVPMIPGLTLPWSHLVPLSIALAATQIVHEAGHAICAALYNLEPEKIGVMLLYPLIPGAFVVLPQDASRPTDVPDAESDEDQRDAGTNEQNKAVSIADKQRMRLQIIAAGIWHNAVTFALLALILHSPVSGIARDVFWKDYKAMHVVGVDSNSPLSVHIPNGARINALDDVRLDGDLEPSQRLDTWSAYLSYEGNVKAMPAREQGWCIPGNTLQGQRGKCCDRLDEVQSSNYQSEGVCFVNADVNVRQRLCLDPLTILVQNKTRCSDSCPSLPNGGGDQICVVPDEREQLLRLTVLDGSRSPSKSPLKERIVLFQGDRRAVFQTVRVTPYEFRLSYASWLEWLLESYALIVQYTFTLSLAMAIFNMLPLPTLDGDIFLLSMLEVIWQRMSASNNQYQTLSRSGSRRKDNVLEQLHSRLRWALMALTMFVVCGSVIVHTIQT